MGQAFIAARMTNPEKFLSMFIAVAGFLLLIALVLWAVSKLSAKYTSGSDRWSAVGFIGLPVLLLTVGLVYPALYTIALSFFNKKGFPGDGGEFVGLKNYSFLFTDEVLRSTLTNTAIWVLVTPILATAIGLIYAVLVDGSRIEAFGKAIIFLPMAISFVGASIIWKFVYDYRPASREGIGLLNEIIMLFGFEPVNFFVIDTFHLNTLLLIVVMIWTQAGFAMTILSAAIKAIPADIVEAAKIDGVSGFGLFRHITIPSIRPTLIVVLVTLTIGTLKVFDIVRTMTGGRLGTNVIANEFYSKMFTENNFGVGAALATLVFILVIPIVIYNIRQLRQAEGLN